MKYIGIGTLLSVIGIGISFVFWDVHRVADVTGAIGLVFLIVAFLMSGAFVSGDRIRANTAMETDEGRKQRNRVVTCSLLIAIPNFLVMLGFYFGVR